MKKWHRNWLQRHPWRTKEWLQERLRDGFDIHHLDNNPFNHSPDNLILVDGNDHRDLLHKVPNSPRVKKVTKKC